ncbi:MAG: carbohydrate kinase [Bacteroidota bacterium]
MNDATVVCFGEVLWDIFPDKKVMGGAPLNVALRLHSLGVNTKIISRVGKDANGHTVFQYLEDGGLSTALVQEDEQLKTGEVLVALDHQGNASYEISKPVAWDAIGLTPIMVSQVKNAPFFLFGSLALRGTPNIRTMRELLSVARTKIFDVNLRAPHYHISMVYELMQIANVIKVNDEELEILCSELGCQAIEMKERALWLEQVTKTHTICITRGAEGALLLHLGKFYEHGGFKIEVEDTVGAGDSFLATLVKELFILEHDPKSSLRRACAMGALVASRDGANCKVSSSEVDSLL